MKRTQLLGYVALVVVYLLMVVSPWVALHVQELWRYGDNPGRLWPTYTIISLFYLMGIPFLGWLATSRQVDTMINGEEDAPPTNERWLRVGFLLALLGLVAWLGHLALRYLYMPWYEPLTFFADMIPLVQSVLHDFWVEGMYPYRRHQMPGYPLPLTFPPGLWLPFSIPWMFHADLRLWQFAALIAVGVLFCRAAILGFGQTRRWQYLPFLLVPCMLIPLGFTMGTMNRFFPWMHLAGHWFFLVGWALAALSRRPVLAGIFLGMSIATRPYMILILPLAGLLTLLEWRSHLREHLRMWISCILTGLVVVVPFLLYNPQAFTFGMLHGYTEQLGYKVENEPFRVHGVSLGGLLQAMGIHHLRTPIQLLALLLVYTFAWPLMKRDRRWLLFLSSLTLYIFLSLSLIPWHYTMVDPFLLLAVPLLYLGTRRPEPVIEPHVAVLTPALLLTCAIVANTFFPPEALGFKARGQSEYFHEIRLPSQGFDYPSWAANSSEIPLRVTDQYFYISLPAYRVNHDTLTIDLSHLPTERDTYLLAWINTVPLGTVKLDGRSPVRFEIKPRTLFHGANSIWFRLWQGDHLSPEDVEALDLRFGATRFEGGRVWQYDL
ncbi:MAG: hypothetical protein JJU11_02145 [Candidatus Sumerlaeia bacterium]|nr:hypothetical protein [Candidatus Sumerlaeia bacterium]